MFKTEQEKFWSGEFGNEYIDRNKGDKVLASNISFFSSIIARTGSVSSVIELGSNIGMNIRALKHLLPETLFSAVEINAQAVEMLREIPDLEVHHSSILDYEIKNKYELSLIKGVLIHINPNELHTVYEVLYNSSSKYICVAEYYNPSPVEVRYRGHEGKLFKRDFAGEILEKYPDLKLIDYGFAYHRDPVFPQDDITWFLLEKS